MIKKSIRIKLTSLREATNDQFFGQMLGDEIDEFEDEELPIEEEENEPEGPIEMFSEGELYITDDRVIIAYDESELTGMEGSSTQVRFERNAPELVTMMRSGNVSTILVFEEGKRHICTYQTPYMPFEICVYPCLPSAAATAWPVRRCCAPVAPCAAVWDCSVRRCRTACTRC